MSELEFMTKPIPEGYHTVTPSFTFKDCRKAIAFYTKAFGAELLDFLSSPNGQGTMHATLKIGNSMVRMGDEIPGGENGLKSAETMGASPIDLYVYVPDVDAAFKRAVDAGGRATMPVADAFWGDRVGQIKDPFGYLWMLATRKQDLNDWQIRKGAEVFFAQMVKK